MYEDEPAYEEVRCRWNAGWNVGGGEPQCERVGVRLIGNGPYCEEHALAIEAGIKELRWMESDDDS